MSVLYACVSILMYVCVHMYVRMHYVGVVQVCLMSSSAMNVYLMCV